MRTSQAEDILLCLGEMAESLRHLEEDIVGIKTLNEIQSNHILGCLKSIEELRNDIKDDVYEAD